VAWDLLTNPATRQKILEAHDMQITEKQGGRVQVGATFHCVHQGGETPQFILDWQPVEYLTTQDTVMKVLGAGVQFRNYGVALPKTRPAGRASPLPPNQSKAANPSCSHWPHCCGAS